MADSFKNFIAGEWVVPTTGAYFENRNPADWNEVIGCFPRSGPDDVARAVAAAQRGFAQWSKTPAPIRGDVLHRVGDLLVQRKDEIARAMTREMGKVTAETRGDVQEGIDTAYYAHTEGRRLVGRAMVEHPDISVISFTGSTETGSIIGATCGRMHKRLSLEMGGKNAMIVMDDADLDLALEGVLWGAFGTTGQRCTATSRLIVHERVHDRLVTMLCDRAE